MPRPNRFSERRTTRVNGQDIRFPKREPGAKKTSREYQAVRDDPKEARLSLDAAANYQDIARARTPGFRVMPEEKISIRRTRQMGRAKGLIP